MKAARRSESGDSRFRSGGSVDKGHVSPASSFVGGILVAVSLLEHVLFFARNLSQEDHHVQQWEKHQPALEHESDTSMEHEVAYVSRMADVPIGARRDELLSLRHRSSPTLPYPHCRCEQANRANDGDDAAVVE